MKHKNKKLNYQIRKCPISYCMIQQTGEFYRFQKPQIDHPEKKSQSP